MLVYKIVVCQSKYLFCREFVSKQFADITAVQCTNNRAYLVLPSAYAYYPSPFLQFADIYGKETVAY